MNAKYFGSYVFAATDWQNEPRELGISFFSPIFRIDDKGSWKLEVFRNGMSLDSNNNVCCCLHLVSAPKLRAKVRIYIQNQLHPGETAESIELAESNDWSDRYTASWVASNILSTDIVSSLEGGYCQNDTVKFVVEVSVMGEEIIGKGGFGMLTDFEITEVTTLKSDLKKLLDSSTAFDICLVGKGGRKVKGHKLILCSRSSRLDKMIHNFNYMVGKVFSLSPLVLPRLKLDISDETLTDLVIFIYTDEISSIEHEVRDYIQLLHAAYFYVVPGLKVLSETNLSRLITLENSAEILKTALETNSLLLQEDVNYFINNVKKMAENTHIDDERKETSESAVDGKLSNKFGKKSAGKHVRFVSPPPLETIDDNILDRENLDTNRIREEVQELGKCEEYSENQVKEHSGVMAGLSACVATCGGLLPLNSSNNNDSNIEEKEYHDYEHKPYHVY